MQSKSTFLEFLDKYSSLQFPSPPPKIIQGLALAHIPLETENSFVQIESAKV